MPSAPVLKWPQVQKLLNFVGTSPMGYLGKASDR